MNIPQSASDATPKGESKKDSGKKEIAIVIDGEKKEFTVKEALSIASRLIISVEVICAER